MSDDANYLICEYLRSILDKNEDKAGKVKKALDLLEDFFAVDTSSVDSFDCCSYFPSTLKEIIPAGKLFLSFLSFFVLHHVTNNNKK